MPDETVSIAQGRLRGFRDGRAMAWLGIPYAAPPLGSLRFRAPTPPEPWTGERDATRFGSACLQPATGWGGRARAAPGSSEDCLLLNVWSPSRHGRRPVLVWVHGGAFVAGSASLYRGGPLASLGDVVVVTLNYRLGVFGFVNLEEFAGEGVASNAGLRDIVAALAWVNNNIAAFGGDPDAVTLAGESAGAVAVHLLTSAEAAAPLYHRVILQSGAATLANSSARSLQIGRAFCDALGGSAGSLADLQRLPAETLLAAQATVARRRPGQSPAAPWFDGSLLPASLAAAQAAPPRPVPLLAGWNRDEMLLFQLLPTLRILPTDRAVLRRLLARDLGDAAGDRVDRAYPSTRGGTRALAGDLCFGMPTLHLAERQAEAGGPTWLYRFDYSHPLLGAYHALELLFLFPSPGPMPAALRGGFLTGLRSGLSERIRGAWTSFVRTGDPGEDWPRFAAPDRATRLFALQDRVVPDPFRRQREVWRGRDVAIGGDDPVTRPAA